ncbi:unnamed protein product [Paramecium pentaurelia]|uniref:Rad21/Rec8-like protein N-terminal domain-containing protein n=1 Tax=Paramecium pentaurelia TaxID=43138 RepID=A0A8S1VGY9_9CILI|nr:unnamed protein product [Paramecium pentaurelia]
MIEEEDVINTSQFNKIIQISYMGGKLSKLQLQQMNLEKIINQCIIFIQDGASFRECTNYLHGLAMVYLKQYQLLRQEILSLQNSMMNKENFFEVEKKDARSKNKQTKSRQNQQKEAITELQEHSNSSRDNPRNIASAERLQLDSQKTPFDINLYLRKEDSDSSNGFGTANFILKDVQSIEKQSLKEILNNRRNQKELSQASSKEIPLHPQIIINDADNEIQEEQFQFQNEDENDEIMDTRVEVRHGNIMKALEEFGISFDQNQQAMNQTKLTDKSKRNTKKQQTTLSKQLDHQDKDRVLQENYQRNLEEFIKYQDKMDDLQMKMDLMNLQPEFWSKQDDLIHMINQYEIPLNQTIINNKNQPLSSYSKMQGMTTIENSNNQFQDIHSFDYQQEISEFQSMDSNRNSKSIDINSNEYHLYKRLIQDLRNEFSKENVISSINYFKFRQEENKAKSFYDLLLMSRLGLCQIKKEQQIGKYTNMLIEL